MSTAVPIREQRRLETRQRLLGAAAEVIAEHGVEGARLEDIAARAGYTQGAIYHQFGSKSGLVAALMESTTIPLADVQDVETLGPAVATAIRDNPAQLGLLYQTLAYALREPGLLAFMADALAEGTGRVTDRLRELGDADAAEHAIVLQALTLGLAGIRLVLGPGVVEPGLVERAMTAIARSPRGSERPG